MLGDERDDLEVQPPQRRRHRRADDRRQRDTSSPLAIAVEIARPMTEERRLGWSRLASMNSAMCAIRTTV